MFQIEISRNRNRNMNWMDAMARYLGTLRPIIVLYCDLFCKIKIQTSQIQIC